MFQNVSVIVDCFSCADYFLEALYGLAQGSPNFFVRKPLCNSSRTGHLT